MQGRGRADKKGEHEVRALHSDPNLDPVGANLVFALLSRPRQLLTSDSIHRERIVFVDFG